jgi:uncharacterized protein (DUF1501 family)
MSGLERSLLSRRALLAACASSSLGVLLGAPAVWAGEGPTNAAPASQPVLVCLFLRGAADGLSIVVPHGDADYYRLRPSLSIPRPDRSNGAVDLDGRFGLHPRLRPLKALYDAGELALVHAVGSPHPTRSHFEAQDYMETAAVGDRKAAQGWLARCLHLRPAAGFGALRAVALSTRSPLSLRGYPAAIATPNLRAFRLSGDEALEPVLAQGFERLYRSDSRLPAERAGAQALSTSALVRRAMRIKTAPGVNYSGGARDFADLARLIKADAGLEAAWLDMGGWDTHRGQGSSERGTLPRQLERLGRALSAFRADLAEAFQRVVIVVMSEFGRTARENGSGGTDHGHGSVMLVLGGNVKGGRVLGSFPGLADEQLHEGRDLAVTTDFRDLLAEVCERHLGCADATPLFPGFRLDRSRRLGLFA